MDMSAFQKNSCHQATIYSKIFKAYDLSGPYLLIAILIIGSFVSPSASTSILTHHHLLMRTTSPTIVITFLLLLPYKIINSICKYTSVNEFVNVL